MLSDPARKRLTAYCKRGRPARRGGQRQRQRRGVDPARPLAAERHRLPRRRGLGLLIGRPTDAIEEVEPELRFACLDLATAVAIECERREIAAQRTMRAP